MELAVDTDALSTHASYQMNRERPTRATTV